MQNGPGLAISATAVAELNRQAAFTGTPGVPANAAWRLSSATAVAEIFNPGPFCINQQSLNGRSRVRTRDILLVRQALYR